MYGDHSCSPGESGDELGAGWLWAMQEGLMLSEEEGSPNTHTLEAAP